MSLEAWLAVGWEVGVKVFLAGRVALEVDGVAIGDDRFPGRQGRLLFAYLVLEDGRPVPRDRLAAALWEDSPPPTWDKALSVLVSKLRGVLAAAGVDAAHALTGAFGCYRLELPAGSWVDVEAAEAAAADAERALAHGRLATAKAAAVRSESLLRGPFLPGDRGTWVEDRRRALADVRIRALDAAAGACLGLGEPHAAVCWAEREVELEPFRETGHRLLMQAHAEAGNRAEALRAYERCRVLLADELGAYPSPETEQMYLQLLEAPRRTRVPARPEPPALALPEVARPPRPASRRQVALVASVVVLAVASASAATSLLVRGTGVAAADVSSNAVVAVDDTGSVVAHAQVGSRPVAAVAGAGSLWVANLDDQDVTRVDPATGRVLGSVPVGGSPTSLAVSDGSVWVSDEGGRILRIDPAYDRALVAQQMTAGSLVSRGVTWPMAAGYGSLWVVDPDGYVARLDLGTGRQTATVEVGNEPAAIAVGDGALWVANSADGTVTRIDPTTLLATTMPVGHGPVAVAVNSAGVWVADKGDGSVVRLDPTTAAVAGTIRVGDSPTAVLATPTAVWVTNGGDGTVTRLNPRSGRVTGALHLGGSPTALAAAAGRVWVTLAPAAPTPALAGGVARLTVRDDFATLDPALALPSSPQLVYATCAGLVTYPDADGPAGSQIVPEVAESVPTPTDGGRTYAFTIRDGFRFSPPSDQPVTAQTFKSTIERVTSPQLASPLASVFSLVLGYADYRAGRTSGLAGVVADGTTLTIRLTRPDGALMADLAGGAACAVPVGTPDIAGGMDTIPSAGPYYVASYAPRQQLVLRRNPEYGGSRPHRLDELVVTIGVDSSQALREIEAGVSDYALDGVPGDAAPLLEQQYGADSPAALASHQQYLVDPAPAMRWLHMNTSRPLFASIRMRQAVNYAIDRMALAALGAESPAENPFNAGLPTADYQPSVVTGTADLDLYPASGPDLGRARQLAGDVHATAVLYSPNTSPWVDEAEIVKADLAPLGIDVRITLFPIDEYYGRIGRRGEPFDLAVSDPVVSTTDPEQLLERFDGSTITATDNSDFSYLDDPAFDRQLHAAAALSGPERYRAYRRLEVELERDIAPVAAFAADASRDLFSARMGCETYQPLFGIDLAALCLRH